ARVPVGSIAMLKALVESAIVPTRAPVATSKIAIPFAVAPGSKPPRATYALGFADAGAAASASAAQAAATRPIRRSGSSAAMTSYVERGRSLRSMRPPLVFCGRGHGPQPHESLRMGIGP